MANKNRHPVAKRILAVSLTVLFVLLIVAFLINAAVSKKQGKPTFLFGYALLWVQTGSMEPTIPARSYILVRASDGQNIPDGTIVTYLSRDETSPVYGAMITHRILSEDADGYHTKGDNAAAHPDTLPVLPEDIVATYVTNLPILSAIGRVFASPIGLLFVLAFFLATTTFLYIPDIISALKEDKNDPEEEKEKEIRRRIDEEIKRLEEQEKRGEKK